MFVLDRYLPNTSLQEVCRKLENSRKRYGRLYKFEIHLHTPASEDYQIEEIENKNSNEEKIFYKDRSVKWILEYALKIGMITQNEYTDYLTNFNAGIYGPEYMEKLKEYNLYFDDFKEFFTYQMIVYKLYKEGIEGVIISDHNTITGYDKLKSMISYCYKNAFLSLPKKDIWLILGIEISCADKNHVVAIIDEKNRRSLERYIEDNIVSNADSKYAGTIDHSLTVLKKIHDINGKAYIAHINTSNFKYFTGTYKHQLFNSPYFDLIGVTKTDYKFESVARNYCKKTNSDICMFYESDSHGVNTIGKRNTWIKMQSITYGNLLKAISSYNVSIYPFKKPEISPTFIKGLYIPENEDGFLNNDNKSAFYFNFSKDLNCIIGGRGTGKSTILKILDVLFSLEVDSKKTLNFICNHGMIYILFRLNCKDYILRFIPQINTKYDPTSDLYYPENALKRISTNLFKLNLFWIDIYQIKNGENKGEYLFFKIEPNSEKEKIIKQIYKRNYSISSLVNSIENNNFSNTLQEIIFNGQNQLQISHIRSEIIHSTKGDFLKNAGANLTSIRSNLLEWRQNIQSILNDFNTNNNNILSVELRENYDSQEYTLDLMFKNWLENLERDKDFKKQFVKSTTLKWNDAYEFIKAQISTIGALHFFEALFNKQHKYLESNYKIHDFVSTNISQNTITHGLKDAKITSVGILYSAIRDHFANFRWELADLIQHAYKDTYKYELYFNINSREDIGISNKPNFKSIEFLSLGQKVVAILTFIIKFGQYSKDVSPLIIDQPEDNLDNQFIYKTLVKSLQNIKNERQIIIVTHNSTLVMNAGAEQIIILDTRDSAHSYLKDQGYIGNKKIIEHIINYLEGGKEAFQHKVKEYTLVLNN